MLTFAHIADLHFGRAKHSSIDLKTGLQTSLVNDMQSLHEFIDIAEKEKVELFVMAGDIFDKIHVSNAVRKEVATAFRRILNTMHLYVIVGTHDRAHDKYAAHTLSDWKNLAGGDQEHMARLHIFDSPNAVFHRDNEGRIQGQVIAFPEPNKGVLEGRSYLKWIKEELEELDIKEDIPTLMIAHFTVTGAKTGDEAMDIASLKPRESVPVEFFDEREYIDYVALGHIHVTQELGKTGKIVYPGSLNYCSFSEVNAKKGGYICSISDDKKLTKKFVELSSPVPMKEIRLDLRGDKDPMETVRRMLKPLDNSRTIVKTVLKMHESEYKNIDETEVRALLKNSLSSTLSFDIERGLKVRDASISFNTAEDEAFEKYLGSLNYEESMKQAMREEFQIVLAESKKVYDA